LQLVAVGGVLAALGGCVYSSEKERVVPGPQPVVVAPTDRGVVTYAEGRWQLYGAGTAASPHYWAWIPAGTAPPPPPPLPRMGG
jgi:hypothetical protein